MTSNKLRTLGLLLLTHASAAFAACSTDDAAQGEFPQLVPAGKSDDYYSSAGQEYTVTGKTTATIDPACLSEQADAEDPTKHCQLSAIGLKNFSVAWFLNTYLIDKHDAANEDWGGFTAMTRPASYEALEISAPDENGKFSYTFTSELSGPMDLLTRMPTEACGEATCFTLEVPVVPAPTLAEPEWFRNEPYKSYEPSSYEGEKEALQLQIEPYPRSNDAYLEYDKLFSDEQLQIAGGKLAIGVFVGWDYYEARYDLKSAKELYRWLTVDRGFRSPVARYEDLKVDSGDFEKTIRVDGREITVAVKLVHPGQGDPADSAFAQQMKDAMIEAFSERQVISYEGHAGPLYGFALSDWNNTTTGELDDSELPGLEIPQGFYQVVLSSGCDTYMVADSLYSNPVKAGRVDLDIITTSSFSNAAGNGRTTKALIDAVINQDADGGLEPKMYGELLRRLNQEYYFTPLYGVHGIDDNPRNNPFADESLLCAACDSNEACGGYDNTCVDLDGSGELRCTTKCQTDDDCAEGFACFDIATGNEITARACAPTSRSC